MEVSHNIKENGTLLIYVDGKLTAAISECNNMSKEEIEDLIEEVLNE